MTVARRNAIVSGAASGLGRAFALRLAADGWCIALVDIDEGGCQETLRLVESAGGAGCVERVDVARLEDWQSLHKRMRSQWSQLDLLVNNAGIACFGDVGIVPIEEWDLLLNVNLKGAIYGCHTLIDWLKANPNGSNIINVASFAAIAPSPSMAPYNVTKAGVTALSESLYGELKSHGVGVSVVCPMHFQTNINSAARSYNEIKSKLVERHTQQSTLTAAAVADAAIRAMNRKQLYVIPGWRARWYWWMRRMTPTAFLDGMARDAQRRAREMEALRDESRGTA